MSKQSVAMQGRQATTPAITSKTAHCLAEMVLRVLDKTEYRGGKVVEYRDSFSDGVVRIFRDADGRVYFRAPRVPEASIRLEPNKSKALLVTRNVRPLELFLEKNPLLAAFLDEDKLRGA